MQNPFRRFKKKRRAPRENADLAALAPVMPLIAQADPAPHLLRDIEAAIDAEAASQPATSHARSAGRSVMIAWLIAGVAIGAGGALVVQPQQQIIAKPAADSPWIPLGTVVLRGSALRSFLRAKCEGQTHFFITMHGFHDQNGDESALATPLLMADGEKILMACIF